MDPLTLLAIFLFLGPPGVAVAVGWRFGQSGCGAAFFSTIIGLALFYFRREVLTFLFWTHPIIGIILTLVIGGFAWLVVKIFIDEWRVLTPVKPLNRPVSDEEVDRIMAKIQREGENGLTRKERRVLATASSDYQRRKDALRSN